MHIFKPALLFVLCALAVPWSSASSDIGLVPNLFGIHLHQTDSEFLSVVKDANCDIAPDGLSKKTCKGAVLGPEGLSYEATGLFVQGALDELVIRSSTEHGCRLLTSSISSRIGKPKATKNFKLIDLVTDMTLWSDKRQVQESTWVLISLCSPNGPGRILLATAETAFRVFPK